MCVTGIHHILGNGSRKVTVPVHGTADVLTLCLEERIESGDALPVASLVNGGVWIEPAAAMEVRTVRLAQGRTLAELARALGTSWAAAQKLESPRANPTIKQLERTAAALGKRLVLSVE